MPPCPGIAAMDARSIVAVGALNTAAEASQAAAMRQLMLDWERRSMEAEDLRARDGLLDARVFTYPPMAISTWERAYAARHNDFLHLLGFLRAVLRQLRRGDIDGAMEALNAEVSDVDSESVEGEDMGDED